MNTFYYPANNNPFNLSLLINFLAGEGNDLMGGSSRLDNLWGGTGNDTLQDYAGDDNLIGFTASNEAKQSLSANDPCWEQAA